MNARTPVPGFVADELSRLREQAASLLRDQVAPAASGAMDAMASPPRRALDVLVPAVSQYGGLVADLLHALRRPGRTDAAAPQPPAAPGTRFRVIPTVAVAGAVLAVGFAAYALAAARTPRRRAGRT